ncbi:LytR C-terminal domain-containing protein [Arthrobacter sp. GCM10027362]|uniref:LytR C-terminal domain-containing protein n=1 Tax=Arthrobacter sp. GCM10027362 TaxID=3273379 RepID=UPI00363B9FC8
MTKYPQDEFDQVPETSDRQGVHRATLAAPKAGGLGLIILAAGLALAVGVLSFFVLPLLGAGGPASPAVSAGPAAAAATSAAPEAEPAAQSASAEPVEEPAETDAGKPETKSAEPTEAAAPDTPEVPAGADKSDPVLVLNGTAVAGLGSDVSATVSANGWQVAGVDNWTGSTLASSVIFYNPGQQANAEELSALLNIGDVRQTGPGEISDGLTVVLGPGFQS